MTTPNSKECLCDCHNPDFKGWIMPITKNYCCTCTKPHTPNSKECCDTPCKHCPYRINDCPTCHTPVAEVGGDMNEVRAQLEKIAWKHYDPDLSINVEAMLDEMMPVIRSRFATPVAEVGGSTPTREDWGTRGSEERTKLRELIEAAVRNPSNGNRHEEAIVEFISKLLDQARREGEEEQRFADEEIIKRKYFEAGRTSLLQELRSRLLKQVVWTTRELDALLTIEDSKQDTLPEQEKKEPRKVI